MRLVQFNMVVGQTEDGEDELVQEVTTPVAIVAEKIRNFYPRKPDRNTGEPRIGTRITLDGGAGIPVTETMDQVIAALSVQ